MGLESFITNSHSTGDLIRRPFIIAEAGVNHEGSMELAKRLINEAKQGGADAIKFQSYKADSLASKDSPSYWDLSKEPIESQHDLFKKYDKFWKKEFEELKNFCDKTGIEFLSTPFDMESANFLNDLSHYNPFFHMIDGFRYSFINNMDGSFKFGLIYLTIFSILTWLIAFQLYKKGYKIKT